MLGPEPWKDGANWYPSFYTSDHTTANDQPAEPLTPLPQFAEYPIRPCLFCGELTNREACERCHITQLDPVFGILRAEVQAGTLTDFDGWNHTDMQTMYQAKADNWHGWRRIFAALIERAIMRGFNWTIHNNDHRHRMRGWFFHPEYFADDGEGKAAA